MTTCIKWSNVYEGQTWLGHPLKYDPDHICAYTHIHCNAHTYTWGEEMWGGRVFIQTQKFDLFSNVCFVYSRHFVCWSNVFSTWWSAQQEETLGLAAPPVLSLGSLKAPCMCEGRKITSWVASLLTPLVSVGGGPEGPRARGPEGRAVLRAKRWPLSPWDGHGQMTGGGEQLGNQSEGSEVGRKERERTLWIGLWGEKKDGWNIE